FSPAHLPLYPRGQPKPELQLPPRSREARKDLLFRVRSHLGCGSGDQPKKSFALFAASRWKLASKTRPGREARYPEDVRSPARLPALLRAAARARRNAYAPYSGFAVGAAVLAGGRIFAAGNLDNSAYPLSVCAERNAVAMAVAGGFGSIDAVAVVAGQGRPAPPCGGCRQVLAEVCAPGTPVIYAASGGRSVTTTLAGLLPDAFGPADLVPPRARRRSP